MSERVAIFLLNIVILALILIMQILIPYISRRNILLGVKIPKAALDDAEVKGIIRGYIRSNILVGTIALLLISYGIYYYNSVILLTISPLIFTALLFLIYIQWNKKLKVLKESKEWEKLASNIVVIDTKFSRDRLKTAGISPWWILLPLTIILLNSLLSVIKYPSLPEKLPTHWDFKGNIDGYMNKSFLVVLMMPGFQLFTGLVMYLSYYAVAKSKQEINSLNPEVSLKKNFIFRRSWSIFFLTSTILIELLFSIAHMMILGIVNDIRLFNAFNILSMAAITGGAIFLTIILGQGGDRLTRFEEVNSNGYDLDDDKLWKLGNSIYYNPDDPSLIVEKRLGVGWTVNAARPLGMLFLILPFIVVALTIFLIK